jgi:hypothetical protein
MLYESDPVVDRDEDEGGLVSQGSLADRGGQGQLARVHPGHEGLPDLVGTPAIQRESSGHHRGQGPHGELGGAPADLGEKGGGVEDTEGQQAGLGQFLPRVSRRQHLRGQAGHRLLGFPRREIHNQN